MNASNVNRKIFLGPFLMLVFCLFVPQSAFGQMEKLGIVQYTPPKGMKKTPKENVVAFSNLNEATGSFCIITLYGATPGTGNAKSDFTREWNNLVVQTLKAEANPKTETVAADGWTAIAGGAAVEAEVGKAVAFLTVISGFGKTVSILAVFNDQAYSSQVDTFISGIELDKTSAGNLPPQPKESLPTTPSTNAEAMNVVALVREFETNEVRATGLYDGRRMLLYGHANKVAIEKDGRISLMFKSSISTSANAFCYFSKSEGSRVASVNVNDIVTVEGTVIGWTKKYNDSLKQVFILENCVIP